MNVAAFFHNHRRLPFPGGNQLKQPVAAHGFMSGRGPATAGRDERSEGCGVDATGEWHYAELRRDRMKRCGMAKS